MTLNDWFVALCASTFCAVAIVMYILLGTLDD